MIQKYKLVEKIPSKVTVGHDLKFLNKEGKGIKIIDTRTPWTYKLEAIGVTPAQARQLFAKWEDHMVKCIEKQKWTELKTIEL
jgi:hypothetical protein